MEFTLPLLKRHNDVIPPGNFQSGALPTRGTITINVPLFKKLRDIIFFGGENHFMSHFEGHFEGAKTFLTP